MRDAKAHPRKIASVLTAHIHIHNRRNVNRGCECRTSRNSLYLPHVCRCMYPDFVTCEDQPAHHTVLSAPSFLEQNIKHFVGPDLGPNCLVNKFVTASLGGGGRAGSGTANSISRRQRDRVMVHGHVFEIKEADYQTTCCCCFKTRVARGGLGTRKRT